MSQKTPALLVVLVDAARLRWFVAAVGLDGQAVPLLRSVEGDLERYRGLEYDDQVSFLRHRLCGVVQRGCDRLWARGMKACHFVFVFEGLLPDVTGRLTQAIADHFSLWMLNPPVVVYYCPSQSGALQLEKLAGDIESQQEDLVRSRLGNLLAAQNNSDAWDLSQKKSTWQPEG
jgi:hypothetical protein